MTNPNFESLLDRPADDVKPPPTLPAGPYLTVLQGLPEKIESSKKKTPGFRFIHKIISPLDGVDDDALALIEGGVSGKTVRNDMWVTEDSLFMLTQFLENCGVEMAGKSISACIDETPNRQVVIFIKHESSDDGERIFAKVGKTAPADA
jgi:hypothetical protein